MGELGYERRAIDAIFRGCDVIALPGYTRPLITVGAYRDYLERSTYVAAVVCVSSGRPAAAAPNRGGRVRKSHQSGPAEPDSVRVGPGYEKRPGVRLASRPSPLKVGPPGYSVTPEYFSS